MSARLLFAAFAPKNLEPAKSIGNKSPIKTVKNTRGTKIKDDFLSPNPSFIEQRANNGAIPIKSKDAVATAGICTNMPAISKVKIPTMRTKQEQQKIKNNIRPA